MRKYYTRACNFYYGNYAKKLVKAKKALPLAGNSNIAFDQLEIFERMEKCCNIFVIISSLLGDQIQFTCMKIIGIVAAIRSLQSLVIAFLEPDSNWMP